MKTSKIVFKSFAILAYLLFYQLSVESCPRCNKSFYDDLLSQRGNTLAGQELLAAITNQSNGQQPLSFAFNNTSTKTTGSEQPSGQQEKTDFIEIINRDNNLSIPPTSYVAQDSKYDAEVTIELYEGEVYLGKGVMFKGFTTNGTIPGPTIIVNEGDIVKFTVVNKGSVPHGASIHSAYTQTSKYLGKINAGETKSMLFRVPQAGVYMYHCAPGGHAIPMHVLFGQYGMMVVKPKQPYKMEQILNKKPDVELYMLQHEIYSSGKDAIEGTSLYTMFNGKLFRYVEEPVKAKPGDYVRIYYLNVGPNHTSTFHIVGILWDYVYWQGHSDKPQPGGQTVLSGPSDSWVIEFRMPPDEGAYLMLDHVVGNADRGAIGILQCTKDAQTPVTITAEGPKFTPKDMADMKSKIVRTVSPFEPGSPDIDPVQVFGPETKEVVVKIIGNSFYPKSIQITEGTSVKWINEDVFTYMEGEFSGIHSVATYESPEPFASPLFGHTESYVAKFETLGDYKYMCAPHPYMRGVVTVVEADSGSSAASGKWLMGLSIVSFILLLAVLFLINSIKKKYTAPEAVRV
jgi:nitrite reductase (NO-forming)